MPWQLHQANKEEASEISGASSSAPFERAAGPRFTFEIWPHRSLSRAGFYGFLLMTWLAFTVPLAAFLGTVHLWVLLPFTLVALAATWWFIERNYRDGTLVELVEITPETIRVVRHEPDGTTRRWEANPYWVRIALRPDGPVENYLTLKGGGREIELGAFLSPEERIELKDALENAIARARSATGPGSPG